MVQAFSRGLAQLLHASLRSLVLISIAASVCLMVALAVAAWMLIDGLGLSGIAWLDDSLAWLGAATVVAVAWLFFPSTTNLVSGLLLDRVASRVESRYYPHLPPARAHPLAETVTAALKFLLLAVALNVLALPVYLLSTVFAPLVFYALNGYLLGREYFEMVALRRVDLAAALALRRRYLGRLWLVGGGFAFLMTVPIVNLVTPVLATAIMVHLFTGLDQSAETETA